MPKNLKLELKNVQTNAKENYNNSAKHFPIYLPKVQN